MQQAIGSAPAKLLLFGEHAAVYGYPSVGISLPWTINVSLEPSDRWEWGDIKDTSEETKLQQLMESVATLFPEMYPAKVFVNSHIPIGVGFGSSGALCVAIVRAIDKKLNLQMTSDQIWKKAHQLENAFHYKSSGIDAGISTFEGMCAFRGVPVERKEVKNSLSLTLVVGALPRQGNTGILVKKIHDKKESDPSVNEHLACLGDIAKMVQEMSLDPKRIGELASEAQSHLKALGLSVESHDRIFQKAAEMGAWGSKLSGAGCGGAYYIIVKSKDHGQQVIDSIEAMNIPHQVSPMVHLI